MAATGRGSKMCQKIVGYRFVSETCCYRGRARKLCSVNLLAESSDMEEIVTEIVKTIGTDAPNGADCDRNCQEKTEIILYLPRM